MQCRIRLPEVRTEAAAEDSHSDNHSWGTCMAPAAGQGREVSPSSFKRQCGPTNAVLHSGPRENKCLLVSSQQSCVRRLTHWPLWAAAGQEASLAQIWYIPGTRHCTRLSNNPHVLFPFIRWANWYWMRKAGQGGLGWREHNPTWTAFSNWKTRSAWTVSYFWAVPSGMCASGWTYFWSQMIFLLDWSLRFGSFKKSGND